MNTSLRNKKTLLLAMALLLAAANLFGQTNYSMVASPESIDMGLRPNNGYWAPSSSFYIQNLTGVHTYLTEITCDNDYFVIDGPMPDSENSLLMLNGNKFDYQVTTSTNTNTNPGHKSGTITFVFSHEQTLTVSLNADVYDAVTPDVWELAHEVYSFPFTETVNTSVLHNSYTLPGNFTDDKDAVFKLDLQTDAFLSASVNNCENGKIALYKGNFGGMGGPRNDNSLLVGNNVVKYYDFENEGIDGSEWTNDPNYPWTIVENDGEFCIKCGNAGITSTQSSIELDFNMPCDGVISFDVKLCRLWTETGSFYIDDELIGTYPDCTFPFYWNHREYPLTRGTHKLRWGYEKDSYEYVYEYEGFFIANIQFTDEEGYIPQHFLQPGIYYIVASATTDNYSVNINREASPLPIAVSSPTPYNNYDCYGNTTLSWTLGDYTVEYQLLYGETNPPTDVLVDWTNDLSSNSRVVTPQEGKTYYWRVNERNASGTTYGEIWKFNYYGVITPDENNIVYVSPNGTGNGSSWENATPNLQAAIDCAAGITDNQPVIWVAKGEYTTPWQQIINEKPCCFLGHGGVKLYGGFNGDEPAVYDLSLRDLENNATILDAESQCYVVGTQCSEWDGFMMKHGGEGGLYVCDGTSTVRNCKILYSEGNGVFVGGGNLNCFNNEISYHSNTGIRKRNLYSALDLKDCVISHNTQYGVRGTCKVERCHVCNNGNGVSTDSSDGGVLINSVVANNDGFGTDFTFVFNSTIVNNGTGIARCYYIMELYFYNNIIWGNERQWDANWSWGSFYSITMINNAIQGGAGDKGGVHPNITLAGRGETGTSPSFVNPTPGIGSDYEGGNWSLLPTSPCVNYGYENLSSFPDQGSFFNNEMPFTQLQNHMDYDVVGNPRIQKDRIDIGAIESSYDKPEIIFPVRPDANNIIYVKDDGDGDGSSWANATSNLQEAIETSILYEPAATIWVAQGTYSVPDFPFQVKEKLRLYGGFEGTEDTDYDLSQRDLVNHASVLDGNNTVRVLNQSDTLSTATAAIIDGFTLQNGVADNGAGAYLLKNMTLSHCNVRNNTANGKDAGKGGGIYTDQATVRDCFVENNTASQGGGIYAVNSKIIQSHIGNNIANDIAGGIYSQTSDVLQCNVVNNEGDGLLVCADDNQSYIHVFNSILWGNTGNNLAYHSSMAQNNTTVSHCAIEGWQELSHGNIPLSAANEGDFGPHFTEDWQLGEASVCIDAGNSSLPNEALPLYDLNGEPRIQNDAVDIGAFESPYAAPCQEMEVLEVSIPQGDIHDFYGTLLSQSGIYEHSWAEDGCLHLVMLHLHTTQTYYVSENGSGEKDGSSWANALDGNTMLENGYTKFAETLQIAVSGDQFWVAEGTYLPCGDNDATKHFVLNEGVEIYGGFAGTETSLDERDLENVLTIFSGELQGDDDETHNTDGIFATPKTVKLWNQNATLDGVTLTKGYTSSHQGAALLVDENTTVALNHCQVHHNYECAIYNAGKLTITDSELSHNETREQEGGEMAGALRNTKQGTAVLSNCTFLSNYSNNNGAILNSGKMEIYASLFDNNTADKYGTINSPGKMKIHNTTFNNNRSDHWIAVMAISDSLELVNCNITNNYSNYYTATHFPPGGSANFASKRTSGIEAAGYSHVVNCSFINNNAGTCLGGALSIIGTADVENCVFKNNIGSQVWRDPNSGGGSISVNVVIGDADGGALFVEGHAWVTDCVFSDNAGYKGSTIGVEGSHYPTQTPASMIMDRCKIVNSHSVMSSKYGAIKVHNATLTINNSLFVNNGNGNILQGDSGHTIVNNTTFANTDDVAFIFDIWNENTMECQMELNNCIVSGYSTLTENKGPCQQISGDLVTNNTLIIQDINGAEGPLFVNPTTYLGYDENVDPLTYDWTLQPGSPCINAGDATLVNFGPSATDLAGEPRVKNRQIDMGAYEYGTVFMFTTPGNWSEASNWSGYALPESSDEVFIDATCALDINAEVTALTVYEDQSLTLLSGSTLTVTDAMTNADATGLVIKDGAQLVLSSEGVFATMEKDISAYTNEGGYRLIAVPFVDNMAVPEEMTANDYDFYLFDESYPYAEWRNHKDEVFGLARGDGYLYANSNGTTLTLSGQVPPTDEPYSVRLTFDANAVNPGFNVVGNPFTCNAYIDRAYYILKEDGTGINPVQVPATAPIPPGTAVMVKALGENDRVVFTKAVQ